MAERYELLRRRSDDSALSSHSSSYDFLELPSTRSGFLNLSSWRFLRLFLRPGRVVYKRVHRHPALRGRFLRWSCWASTALVLSVISLILFTAIFWPSYTSLPDHYRALQERCENSQEPGRGNINSEKVFIAATLYDPTGTFLEHEWGNAVSGLVDLLGPNNVHLSIYENDASKQAQKSLRSVEERLKCNTSLVSNHLPLDEIYHVTTPSGQNQAKRIAFLAEARNRALRPLTANPEIRYDKLLYINDVIFNPIDAVNLLFSTNQDSSGHAQYRAACAVDFINAFKFYDRFATRDLEGYTTGIPFFPWFTGAGRAESRQDVLKQKDAVRVRSCWGGMATFEAKWFQNHYPNTPSNRSPNDTNSFDFDISPLRFRYNENVFWDASECCLIHADLAYLSQGEGIATDHGIFMNPYVRVAYNSRTLRWLPYTRRVERLYSIIHSILNHAVGMPEYNPRRLEQPGDEVVEKILEHDQGSQKIENSQDGVISDASYREMGRIAGPGRFCDTRKLLVLKQNPKKGEKPWENVPFPP